MNIFAFCASLRQGSLNRILLRRAVGLLKESVTSVQHRDLSDFQIPVYDGDVEDRSGMPAGVKLFVQFVAEADAVVIATPEYNGGIPGVLKNALDWASRNDPNPWDQKPVLLLSASPSYRGGLRGVLHSRVPLEAMGSYVYPEAFGVSYADRAFDEAGAFVDPKKQARLEELLHDFLEYGRKLAKRE